MRTRQRRRLDLVGWNVVCECVCARVCVVACVGTMIRTVVLLVWSILGLHSWISHHRVEDDPYVSNT